MSKFYEISYWLKYVMQVSILYEHHRTACMSVSVSVTRVQVQEQTEAV